MTTAITKNFTLEELCASSVANANKIDNTPDVQAVINLAILTIKCLQPIREYFSKPVIITSGFRCEKLNNLISSCTTSQHKNGMAADFIISGIQNSDIVKWIKDNLEFDQLIEEYSKDKKWIHISYNINNNRNKTLIYANGKYSDLKT